jgi:glycerol-3-phosphate acyltransferase PlsX
MRIAVDAMGGDYGARVVVPGALRGLARLPPGTRLVLLGDESAVRAALGAGAAANVEVVHAPDEIAMDESAAKAVRRKPDSALVRGMHMLRDGEVDAFMSAGSTGAVVVAGTLVVGRIGALDRPAIATLFPTDRSRCVVIDAGANADCKPAYLVQFAAMGAVYARLHLGLERPRVGLLNIGEESSKGNEMAVAAHALLAKSKLHFVGNVEGRDVLAGRADVVVCDGFVGNILLKFGESMLRFLTRQIRAEVSHSWRARAGAFLLRPAFVSVRKRIDYQEEGGAPLLGVNGVVIIAHGKSTDRAIENAVVACGELVQQGLVPEIRAWLQGLDLAPDLSPAPPPN